MSRHTLFVGKRPGAVVEPFFDDDDIDRWTDERIQPIWAIEELSNPPLTIIYEDMNKDQVSVLMSELKGIGVEARRGISGDWKNYFTKRDGELFLDKTGDMLVQMGYEKDASRVDALPEKLHLTTDMSSPTDEPEKTVVDLSPKASAKQPRIDRSKTPFLRRVFRRLFGVDLDRLERKLVNIERNQKRLGRRASELEERSSAAESRMRQLDSQEHEIMKSLEDHTVKSQRAEGRLEDIEGEIASQSERIEGQTQGLRGADERIKTLGERVAESEIKHSETYGRLAENNRRHEVLPRRTGNAERRFTHAEKRFSQIADRLEVFEKRHRYADSRIHDMETFLESLDSNPHAAWIFANRTERMDATLPFFGELRRKFHIARYQFARKYVKKLVVADIACGAGYGAAILAKRGGASRVIGVDIDPDTIKYAREIHAGKRIRHLCTSGDTLGLPDASVDLVVSFETIEHVPGDRALLAEFARVLRPGGRLICSTPNQWPLDIAPYHTREYDRASFKKILNRKFKVLQLYIQNSGSDTKFNHEHKAGIVETTSENEALAEC